MHGNNAWNADLVRDVCGVGFMCMRMDDIRMFVRDLLNVCGDDYTVADSCQSSYEVTDVYFATTEGVGKGTANDHDNLHLCSVLLTPWNGAKWAIPDHPGTVG